MAALGHADGQGVIHQEQPDHERAGPAQREAELQAGHDVLDLLIDLFRCSHGRLAAHHFLHAAFHLVAVGAIFEEQVDAVDQVGLAKQFRRVGCIHDEHVPRQPRDGSFGPDRAHLGQDGRGFLSRRLDAHDDPAQLLGKVGAHQDGADADAFEF
jgi:hypothetical protein